MRWGACPTVTYGHRADLEPRNPNAPVCPTAETRNPEPRPKASGDLPTILRYRRPTITSHAVQRRSGSLLHPIPSAGLGSSEFLQASASRSKKPRRFQLLQILGLAAVAEVEASWSAEPWSAAVWPALLPPGPDPVTRRWERKNAPSSPPA